MAEVTIIVPLYNKAPHIRRCLDSLCGQTLTDIHIIVVDDGSTDDGALTVSQLASHDPRIQLIQQSNAGPAVARNTGLAAADSEFIGFVDADDWIEPRMYELLHAASRSDCISARCGYVLEREGAAAQVRRPPRSKSGLRPSNGGGSIWVLRGGELYNRLFAGPDISLMTACAAIYRRDALASHSIVFDEHLVHTEDALFNAEVYSLDLPIAVTDDILYHYRQSEESLSKRHDSDLYRSVDRLYERVIALEDSLDHIQRSTARTGHNAFARYICWYYAIAVADELTNTDSGPQGFAERAQRIWDDSRLDEVFVQAEQGGLLPLPPRSVWYLIRKGRYGQLAMLLRVFNKARTFRRLV